MTTGDDDDFAAEAEAFRRRVDAYEARVPPRLRGTFVSRIHEAGAQLRAQWTRELLKGWTTRIFLEVGGELLKMSTVVLPPLTSEELREVERIGQVPLYAHQPRQLLDGHPRLVDVRIVSKKDGFHEYMVAIGTRELPRVDHAEWARINATFGIKDAPSLTLKRTAFYKVGNRPVYPTLSPSGAAALDFASDLEWAVDKVRREFEALVSAGAKLKPPRSRLLVPLRLEAPALRPHDAEFLSDETIERAVKAFARPRRKGRPRREEAVCSPGEALLGVWCEMGVEDDSKNGRPAAIRGAQTWIDKETAPSERRKRLDKVLGKLGVRTSEP